VNQTSTIVVGGGQAGLAMSRSLHDRGIDHVVVERGRVGQRWSERWDSLRLLSPNWMTRLPGWQYRGPEPDGFMTRDAVRAFLDGYARSFGAPVLEHTEVQRATRVDDLWQVDTNRGTWRATSLVIATGHSQVTRVPAMAEALSPSIEQITTDGYRRPADVPAGGVLVVGSSASGVQLADELSRAGRDVVLAVGRHTRLPRRYRGRDVMFWLDRIGALRRPLSDVSDPERARHEPSLQLAGNDEGRDLDLAMLSARGVRLVGSLSALDGSQAVFRTDLMQHVREADSQLHHLVERIDRHIAAHGLDAALPAPRPVARVPFTASPRTLSLARSGIRSILWATGYRRAYPWLHAPVFDADGEIRNCRGRASVRGLYVLGLQFMIRRNSSFIDGVGEDAREIAGAIAGELSQCDREAA
jgi:putative flavoprotein involved in K+ transport